MNCYALHTSRLLAIVVSIVASSLAIGQNEDVERYFSTYVNAREATIEGVKETLRLLERGVHAPATLADADRAHQANVRSIYKRYGFTPTTHAFFGTENADEIKSWLRTNNEIQDILDNQDEILRRLSERVRAIREGS